MSCFYDTPRCIHSVQATVTALDGANGRKIPGTVSRALRIIASERRENWCKFMIIPQTFPPNRSWRCFPAKPRKIRCCANHAELMKILFRPPIHPRQHVYNHWNLEWPQAMIRSYQQNNGKLFASPMVELSLKWKINLRLKYLRTFIRQHNFFIVVIALWFRWHHRDVRQLKKFFDFYASLFLHTNTFVPIAMWKHIDFYWKSFERERTCSRLKKKIFKEMSKMNERGILPSEKEEKSKVEIKDQLKVFIVKRTDEWNETIG